MISSGIYVKAPTGLLSDRRFYGKEKWRNIEIVEINMWVKDFHLYMAQITRG
jgi:hypothetical protein